MNYLKPYQSVSKIYSHLMRSIDYKDWAHYLIAIGEYMNTKVEPALELAGGDCAIANVFNNKNIDIVVTDLSIDMLRNCPGKGLRKICCNMTALPFKKKFQFISSSFDSINYLLDESELYHLFGNIKTLLNKEGIFTFDVSLERNSIKNERRLNRKGKVNDLEYFQKSKYDKATKIHYNYFKIILNNGEVLEEMHKQRVYDFTTYFKIIEDCDLYVCECFDAFTFDDANEDSERAQFIVKRRDA